MRQFWAVMLTVAMGAAVLVAVPPALAATDTQDTVGFVDSEAGLWWFVEDQSGVGAYFFGNPGDSPFMGDWDCNGSDTPGLYRQSDGYVYLRNSNTQGIADISFYFGKPGDVPIAGDFNANGCHTVSIYRPSEQRFYIINQLGTNDGGLGPADYSFLFGNPGDKPFVGDFNGNGQDTIGLHRESTGLVYFRNSNTTGIADNQFYFGDPGDRFMAGDWTGDGIDTPGLFRPSNQTAYLRYTNTQGNADEEWWMGISTWLPVAGRLTSYDCGTQTSIPAIQCDALVKLYKDTAGIGWKDRTNWLANSDPCTWYGIRCEEGSVTWLSLPWNQLFGTIPSELGNLTNLRMLELSGNDLTGPIPPGLGSLSNLGGLYLNDNRLFGPIPPQLGNLDKLEAVDLAGNFLSGSIPPELGNLTNLEALSLGSNRLSGPVPPSLSSLTMLHFLLLSGQTGCLTAATPTLATWLSSFDPYWNDGCAA